MYSKRLKRYNARKIILGGDFSGFQKGLLNIQKEGGGKDGSNSFSDVHFSYVRQYFRGILFLRSCFLCNFFGLILYYCEAGKFEKGKDQVILFCIGVLSIVCFCTFGLLPTPKQAAAIIIVPSIINNEHVQQLPDKITQLGLEWLEELRPDTTTETKKEK